MPDQTPTSPPQPSGDVLRTLFAAERTFLAWIRSGLAMMGFGFLIERFGLFLRKLASVDKAYVPHSPRASLWLGTALLALGILVNILASIEHLQRVREIAGNVTWTRRGTLYGVLLSLLLAAVGVALAIYLHAIA